MWKNGKKVNGHTLISCLSRPFSKNNGFFSKMAIKNFESMFGISTFHDARIDMQIVGNHSHGKNFQFMKSSWTMVDTRHLNAHTNTYISKYFALILFSSKLWSFGFLFDTAKDKASLSTLYWATAWFFCDFKTSATYS